MTNRNGSKPVCMKNRTPGDRGNSRPMMSNGIEFLDLTRCPLNFRDNGADFAQRDGRLESPEGTDIADVTPFIFLFSLGCDLPLIFDTNATYQIDERKIA